MRQFVRKYFPGPKVVKFLAGGIVAAVINFVLIYLLVDHLGFNTPLLRNLANLLSIEAGLIASFFIYRLWVWNTGTFALKTMLLAQLPLYHLAGGAALLARSLVIFPVLDWFGVGYYLNTFVGMLVGTVINYFISDRIVFKTPAE